MYLIIISQVNTNVVQLASTGEAGEGISFDDYMGLHPSSVHALLICIQKSAPSIGLKNISELYVSRFY